jgi:hypothetical protein
MEFLFNGILSSNTNKMENQNDMKISIPKPCHESWNEMTPNEKGAFCGKCAKTVIDFTKKTSGEIRDILVGQTGKKTCGRFTSDQLNDPVKMIDLYIPLNLLPKKLSFNKSFAFALFIVFGTTLFSCSTQKGEVVGKIVPVIDTTSKIKKGEIIETRLMGDTTSNAIGNSENITGNVTNRINCVPVKGDVDIEQTLGEIAAPADTMKITDEEEIKKGKIKIEPEK